MKQDKKWVYVAGIPGILVNCPATKDDNIVKDLRFLNTWFGNWNVSKAHTDMLHQIEARRRFERGVQVSSGGCRTMNAKRQKGNNYTVQELSPVQETTALPLNGPYKHVTVQMWAEHTRYFQEIEFGSQVFSLNTSSCRRNNAKRQKEKVLYKARMWSNTRDVHIAIESRLIETCFGGYLNVAKAHRLHSCLVVRGRLPKKQW